jgi:hypothetical protein
MKGIERMEDRIMRVLWSTFWLVALRTDDLHRSVGLTGIDAHLDSGISLFLALTIGHLCAYAGRRYQDRT